MRQRMVGLIGVLFEVYTRVGINRECMGWWPMYRRMASVEASGWVAGGSRKGLAVKVAAMVCVPAMLHIPFADRISPFPFRPLRQVDDIHRYVSLKRR